jgi:3-methyladenine DNA glycosylase/8-oxoguanine DNA glycosylase
VPAARPADDLNQAYRELARQEPVFRHLIHEYGRPAPFAWHDGGRTESSQFAAMMLHIVGQRISAVAAFRIYDRISATLGGIPTPPRILGLGQDRLRTCGLSAAKASYAVALARAQATGGIDIEHLDGLSDAEVITALTAVPGIGVWSAETFLVHNLRRPDILPAGDLGIRRAVQTQWHLGCLPASGDVRSRAAAWTPWRTYAAALLWRSLRPRGEASDPKQRALIKLDAVTDAGSHNLRHRGQP